MKLPVKTRAITFTCRGEGINSNDGQWAPYFYAATTLESALKFARDFNARADYRNMVATALVCLEGIPVTTVSEVERLQQAEWNLTLGGGQGERIEQLEAELRVARKRYDEMREDRDSYRTMFDQLQIDRAKMLSKIQDQLDTLNNIIEEDEND